MEKVHRYQNRFFFILLAISFALVFFILKPFLITLAIAVAFATVLYPIYQYIKRPFGRWASIPTAITILIGLAIIIVPAALVLSQLISESRQAYMEIGDEISNPQSLIRTIETPIQTYLPNFHISIDSIVGPLLQSLSDRAGSIFATTINTVVNIVIFFIALFFLLKDGESIKRWLVDISPLPNDYDSVIVHRLNATINSVIRGSLLVAIIQGIVAGIGYAAFGVPNPTLLGLLTAIASLIPGFGTPIVTLPSAAYLYLTGHPLGGLGMALWGLAAVSLIDNIVGPQIIGAGKGVNIHPFLVLISVLGGIAFFGPWGFVLGPLAISFLLALLDVFGEYIEYKEAPTARLKRSAAGKKRQAR